MAGGTAALGSGRGRILGAWFLAVLLAVSLLPATASGQDLEEVEAEIEAVEARQAELQDRLDTATRALAAAEEAEGVAEQRTLRLAGEADTLAATIAASDARTASRLRSVYINGSIDPLVVLLSGEGRPGEGLERALAVELLVSSDRMDREAAAVAEVELDTTRDRLAASLEAAATAAVEREEAVAVLEADLAASADEVRTLAAQRARLEEEERARAAEAARRAAAARERAARGAPGPGAAQPSSPGPAPSGGALACPLDSPRSFTDTWGAARSGGRRHRGTDIMGSRGNTVRAIVGGTWDVQRTGRSAGLWAILRGNDGNEYWYLHLERHIAGDGQRVSAGQVVGTNGDTGNARGTTPHVHFELHVGGSRPVNPYRTLRGACG
jgi:murein DD-endopeptidase MepM/ murein hydrolase activator NlpD